MNLRLILDREYPGWHLEFGNDPEAAGLELGLVTPEELEAYNTQLRFEEGQRYGR